MVSQCTDRICFGGHSVRSLPSMQPLMHTTGIVRVVWTQLISFDLQPQIRKNCNGAHIKGMHRVMLKYSHVLRAELVSIAEPYTPSKGWIYRDRSTCCLVSHYLVISSWHGCYSACLTRYVSGLVWAVTAKFSPVAFQCGLFQLSFSSGVPVYPASIRWVAQWYPSVHWVNQWHFCGIPVYTGPASVHWLRVRDEIRFLCHMQFLSCVYVRYMQIHNRNCDLKGNLCDHCEWYVLTLKWHSVCDAEIYMATIPEYLHCHVIPYSRVSDLRSWCLVFLLLISQ